MKGIHISPILSIIVDGGEKVEKGCFSVLLLLLRAFPLSQWFSWSGFLQKSMVEETFFFFLMWKCNSTITFKGRSSFRFGQLLDIYIFFNLIEMKKLTCDTKDLVLSVNHLV